MKKKFFVAPTISGGTSVGVRTAGNCYAPFQVLLFSSEENYKHAVEYLNAEWNKHTSPDWISVEDELPEDYQDVLVWEENPGRDYMLSWYASHCGWYKETPDVTHWQPLPDPPEQECKPAEAKHDTLYEFDPDSDITLLELVALLRAEMSAEWGSHRGRGRGRVESFPIREQAEMK